MRNDYNAGITTSDQLVNIASPYMHGTGWVFYHSIGRTILPSCLCAMYIKTMQLINKLYLNRMHDDLLWYWPYQTLLWKNWSRPLYLTPVAVFIVVQTPDWHTGTKADRKTDPHAETRATTIIKWTNPITISTKLIQWRTTMCTFC